MDFKINHSNRSYEYKKTQTDKTLNLSDQTALDDSVLERPALALSNVIT